MSRIEREMGGRPECDGPAAAGKLQPTLQKKQTPNPEKLSGQAVQRRTANAQWQTQALAQSSSCSCS